MGDVVLQQGNASGAQFHVKDPISALTHFIAFVAAVAATPLLLVHAAVTGAALGELGSLSVFMLSMVLLYGASTAYHTFQLSAGGVRFLKKLDHTMIFFLIAGSYTPVCVVSLANITGFRLLVLVWGLAVLGATFKLCWIGCPKWMSSVVYIAMGWSCLTAMPQITAALSASGFFWLLAGGGIYTVGGVIYALKPKNAEKRAFGHHELFHLFIMGGSLCHYIFMYHYV